MRENDDWRMVFPRFATVSNTDDFEEDKSFFFKFAERLKDRATFDYYERIERRLQNISNDQWPNFCSKLKKEKKSFDELRYWSQFHCLLFEVYAHQWLMEQGATSIRFIPEEENKKTPDLSARINEVDVLVEVKTILESDKGIALWSSGKSITVDNVVSNGLRNKIREDYIKAREQLHAFRKNESEKTYVYFVYDLDLDFEPEQGYESDLHQ